jgi:hypothetical protein
MDFKFNFFKDDDKTSSNVSNSTNGGINSSISINNTTFTTLTAVTAITAATNEIEVNPAQKLKISSSSLGTAQLAPLSVPELPGIQQQSLSFCNSPFPGDTDVITGVYEGGLKTWECSLDLAHFLRTEYPFVRGCARVLEVGCGSALPSIAAKLLNPVLHCSFQDYNDSVLLAVTAPNLRLNGICPEECDFYCGDWSGLPALLPATPSTDLILTSETIYRSACYAALLAVFEAALSGQGRVLVAAKDYYFGLGGGVGEFAAFAEGAGWAVKRVWGRVADGVPRSILELRRM